MFYRTILCHAGGIGEFTSQGVALGGFGPDDVRALLLQAPTGYVYIYIYI